MNGLRHGRRVRRGGRTAGFTLLELMVALVAGIIVIGAIYFIGGASARYFHEQQRVAQTQSNVRMAMEQLRRDVERAGFLGVGNSDEARTCGPGVANRIQAIEVLEGEDTDSLPNGDAMGATADRIRLVGNYATADAYRVSTLDASGSTLYLQRQWYSFRRDFGDGAGGVDTEDFERVFADHRYLHIENPLGNHFFVRITGSEPSTASVSFTPSIGIGGTCVGGLADQAQVAPLSRVEYLATDITGDSGGKLQPRSMGMEQDFRGQTPTQLIRREIEFDTPGTGSTVVPQTERIVLEHLAHVDYQLVYDAEPVPSNPPDLEVSATGTAPTAEGLTVDDNDAERVRSVIATLAARTAEQSPRFPWPCADGDECAAAGNGAEQPPSRYQVNPAADGAARVRVLRDEILLPNMAME